MKYDENLHNIIRDKLGELQPAYQDSDWKKMKRKLFVGKMLKYAVPSGIIMTGIMATYFYNGNSETSLPKSVSIPIEKPQIYEKAILPATPPTKADEEKITPTTKKVGLPIRDNESTQSIYPELYNETTEAEPTNEIERLKAISTVTSPQQRKQLEREIRVLTSSGISMSERISMTRELGKSFEQTSSNVLERNISQWKNAVIVCDITSSMFPYTTQVFDWLLENKENAQIQGIVFFTDCDSLGNQARKLPAKMFEVREFGEEKLWNTMFEAIENSENNQDNPENDVAAILYAQKRFPNAQHIILIADNSSSVKDIDLVNKVKKPVHVVACSETYIKGLAFQPDYVKIAKKSNGTLHTNEDDITDLTKIEEGLVIQVGKIFFRYNKGKFYATKLKVRP